MELIFLALLFLLMWFLFIRPQQQRVRKHQELVSSLQVGDEIVTAGGIVGIVRAIDDDQLRVEVARGVEVRLVRGAVSRKLTPTDSGDAAIGAPDTDTDERP